MTSNARVRVWPWAAGIAAAVAAASVVWLLRNTWPVQLLFIYIGLFTGIDVQNLWDPPARWHVKQTLTIETPQGDVTSSVVREKVMRKDRLFGTSPTDELGEALVIEASSGRYLFAVIEERKPNERKLLSIPDDPRVWDSLPKLYGAKGKPLEVPPDQYPLMVTFGDLKDPKSVQQVDPANLSAAFGPGYRIKSYTVEITDEPMTRGAVEGLIPWISTYRGYLRPPSLRLGPGSHNAADVLPVEFLNETNFVWKIK